MPLPISPSPYVLVGDLARIEKMVSTLEEQLHLVVKGNLDKTGDQESEGRLIMESQAWQEALAIRRAIKQLSAKVSASCRKANRSGVTAF